MSESEEHRPYRHYGIDWDAAWQQEQEQTVPVRHEEVRVEREPITDADRATAEISEAEQEVTLYEERPVTKIEAKTDKDAKH